MRKNSSVIKRYQTSTIQARYDSHNFSTMLNCVVGDIISVRVAAGKITVSYSDTTAPDRWHHFEGFKVY